MALEFLSAQLQDDDQIVKLAYDENRESIQFASGRLQLKYQPSTKT